MSRTRPIGWCASWIATLVLGLSACSDPQGADYVRLEEGKLTVDRPAAWSVEMPVEQPWTKGYRLAPESVEQIQVSGDFGEYITATEAMSTLVHQAEVGGVDGFEIVQSREVEIKGATTGRATRFAITDNKGSQVSGEWIVAAHWPYPQSVAVTILGPQFDPDLERRVLESMEMRPVLE